MSRPTTSNPSPIARRVLRALMWTHVVFLISLPFLALVAAVFIMRRSPQAVFLWGFVPGVVYSTAIAASYRVPASLGSALLLVLAVPAQVALGVYLFGDGPWTFLVEEALVEVGSLAVGIGVAMFVHRPTAALGVVVGVAMIAGAGFAYVPPLLRAYEGAHPGWYAFLASAFLTASAVHVRLFMRAAAEYNVSRVPQEVELRYGDGLVGRLLGFGSKGETVGPDFDDDTILVVILPFVVVYVLGGIAICAVSNYVFK